jgi:hypothetical protein
MAQRPPIGQPTLDTLKTLVSRGDITALECIARTEQAKRTKSAREQWRGYVLVMSRTPGKLRGVVKMATGEERTLKNVSDRKGCYIGDTADQRFLNLLNRALAKVGSDMYVNPKHVEIAHYLLTQAQRKAADIEAVEGKEGVCPHCFGEICKRHHTGSWGRSVTVTYCYHCEDLLWEALK